MSGSPLTLAFVEQVWVKLNERSDSHAGRSGRRVNTHSMYALTWNAGGTVAIYDLFASPAEQFVGCATTEEELLAVMQRLELPRRDAMEED